MAISNVVPTDFDIYNPKSWRKDALLQPESRAAYARLLEQGWVDSLRVLHPEERISHRSGTHFRNHWQRDSRPAYRSHPAQRPSARWLRSVQVDRWVRGQAHASDRRPVVAELAPVALGRKRRARRLPKEGRRGVAVNLE